MNSIDRFLNSITMYRLVLYGLIILAAIAVLFGFLTLLPFRGMQFLLTLTLLLVATFSANYVLARVFKAVVNSESYLITTFILFFILVPVATGRDAVITVAAGVIAMASKYLLAIGKKHIFNPTAITIFLLGLFGFGSGIWWVGSTLMLPFVAILGFLVVRKIRRSQLFFVFFGVTIVTIALYNLKYGITVQESLVQSIASWPLVFFGSIMLTEPMTTPPTKRLQMIYGGLVGLLFGSRFHIGPVFSSPE